MRARACAEVFRLDRAVFYHGEAAELDAVLAPNSVDAIVTDPPAGIGFMGKRWDSDKGGRDAWVRWLADALAPAFAALKPGGHALVWAIPRTSHWTALALELCGFEIRDVVVHLFGTGFPKSLSISKAIDLHLGAAPIDLGRKKIHGDGKPQHSCSEEAKLRSAGASQSGRTVHSNATAPATAEAAQWDGWGTALKPAAEHWILARKPLAGTYAANVLAHGTGGLNVDGCRIGESKRVPTSASRTPNAVYGAGMGSLMAGTSGSGFDPNIGRWPANVTLDEEAAAALDEESAPSRSGSQTGPRGRRGGGFVDTGAEGDPRPNGRQYGDSGGASRFFFTAKPSRHEKEVGLDRLARHNGNGARNFHPTVKSTALMRWLCRLITPPRGTVLDPFAGTGTTGVAALREGFSFIGCDASDEYLPLAIGRLKGALAQTTFDFGDGAVAADDHDDEHWQPNLFSTEPPP